MRQIKQLIVHHSSSLRETTTLEMINKWHKDKGFPLSKLGYNIGYHYVIGKDWIKQTRLAEEIGAHALGWNENSIGICLTGNFETEYPNKYQLKELGKLLVGLMAEFGLKESDIKLHKELNQTACPGRNLPRETILGTLKTSQVPNEPEPANTLAIEKLKRIMTDISVVIDELKNPQ